MLVPDRLLGAFWALIRSATPRLDYYTTYRGRVVAQSSSDLKDPGKGDLLDIVPDDPRVPPMAGIPLRLGQPGERVKFDLTSSPHVYVGWSAGDPSQPFCCLPDVDQAVIQITIVADTIYLGGKAVTDKGDLVPILDGVVHGRGVDTFTGLPYFALGGTSAVVAVKKQ